jgi:hypothetical protein
MELPLYLTALWPLMLYNISFPESKLQGPWKLGMHPFLATLPLSDGAVSGGVLKTGYVCSLLACAVNIMVLFLGAVMIYHRNPEEVSHYLSFLTRENTKLMIFTSGLIVPLLLWTIMGLMVSISLTGRIWVMAGFIIIITTLCFAFMKLYFDLSMVKIFNPAIDVRTTIFSYILMFGAAAGIMGMIGTLWAYCAAWRKGLIGARTVWLALGLWLLAIGLTAIGLSLYQSGTLLRHVWGHPALGVPLIGLLALPLAPLATAPLVLSWNRHR